MPRNAYNTVSQNAYWGAGGLLADIGPVISGVDIPSEMVAVRRVVLGSDIPTADVALVSYRASIPRMRMGDESEKMRANPTAWLVLVRTDDLQAMIGFFACNGTPLQAAAQGEIVSNVQLAPAATVNLGTALKMTPAATTITTLEDNSPAFAVVTKGSGTFRRGTGGGATLAQFDGPGIAYIGFSGDLMKPATAEGWIIHNTSEATV